MPSGLIRIEALTLALLLEAGAVDAADVERWAEKCFGAADPYDEILDDLCFSTSMERLDVVSSLRRLSVGEDEMLAMRRALGQLHEAVRRDRELLRSVARFLESFAVRHWNEMPDEFDFMNGADDILSLAEQGIYGRKGDAKHDFIAELGKFASAVAQVHAADGPPASRAART